MSVDDVWDHFEKVILDDEPTEKKAKCLICGNCYNYTGTIHNLKRHLSIKHGIQVACRLKGVGNVTGVRIKRTNKLKHRALWKVFTPTNEDDKLADCKLCGKNLSYKSTTGNLMMHFRRSHPEACLKLLSNDSLYSESDYEEYEEEEEPEEETSEGEATSPPDELWTYFEREGARARCAICRAHVAPTSRALRDHLRASHPKILPDEDADSDQPDEDGEHFTEVIYLEETPKAEEKARARRSRVEYVEVNNRKRRASPPPPPPPPRPKETPKNPEDVELESFGAYIICLLKSLPKDVCSAVQRDIINIIMNAKLHKATEPETSQVLFESTPVIIKTMSQGNGKNFIVLENNEKACKKSDAEESKVEC